MKSMVVLALILGIAVTCNAQASVPLGTSCAEFNATVCVDSPDGTLWEDISSCDTPFCHTTYIVCTNGLPTQFTCPNETVWSQANKTCINRADGPGKCPELCKDFSNALDVCLNMPNGMRLPNPVECRPGGVASSFMYCLNEVPIPTACPADTTWNFQLLSCVTATGVPKNVVPAVPGVKDLPLLPVFRPENIKRRPRVTLPKPNVTRDSTTFMFYVKSLDGEVLDITEADIINAIRNGTGLIVDGVSALNYLIDMDMSLNDFQKPLTPATLQNVETGLQGFFINAFPEVDPRAIKIRGVQGGVSTASIEDPANTITADVRISPNDEPQTAMDIAASLPTFDLLMAQTMRNIVNNTAELLGVPDDIAEYFQNQLMRLNAYDMVGNISVVHRLGKAGSDLLKSAILSGDMSKALSKELGYDVEALLTLDPVVVEAPAPAPINIVVPVTPNGGVTSRVSAVLMAMAGVAAVVCML